MAQEPAKTHTWSLSYLVTADDEHMFPLSLLQVTLCSKEQAELFLTSVDHAICQTHFIAPPHLDWQCQTSGPCIKETWHKVPRYRVPVVLGSALQSLAQTLRQCWDFTSEETKYDPAFCFEDQGRGEGLASTEDAIPIYLLGVVTETKKFMMLWDIASRERHDSHQRVRSHTWPTDSNSTWTTTWHHKWPFILSA